MSAHQGAFNCTQDSFHIVHDRIVPKADQVIALRFKKFGPAPVIFLLVKVLAAIQFNDQF